MAGFINYCGNEGRSEWRAGGPMPPSPPEPRWEWQEIAAVVVLIVIPACLLLAIIFVPDDGQQHCYARGYVTSVDANGLPSMGVVSVEVPCPAVAVDGGAP